MHLRLETYVRIWYDTNMNNQESVKMKQRGINGIKKADIILISVCLLAAVLLEVFFVVHRETGSTVRILHDGVELKRIDLYPAQTDSETNTDSGYCLITYRDDVVGVEYFSYKPEPKLPEGTGYNLISVTDGTVIVEAADCKDQICVHHKPVSAKGESIICLPHRLVVEIIGGKNKAVNIQDGNLEAIPDETLDGVVR